MGNQDIENDCTHFGESVEDKKSSFNSCTVDGLFPLGQKSLATE